MLYACVQRFDVTGNLKILAKFLAPKRCLCWVGVGGLGKSDGRGKRRRATPGPSMRIRHRRIGLARQGRKRRPITVGDGRVGDYRRLVTQPSSCVYTFSPVDKDSSPLLSSAYFKSPSLASKEKECPSLGGSPKGFYHSPWVEFLGH
jgi:hypothetical protein